MPNYDNEGQVVLYVDDDNGPCVICEHAWAVHFVTYNGAHGCDDDCECQGYTYA